MASSCTSLVGSQTAQYMRNMSFLIIDDIHSPFYDSSLTSQRSDSEYVRVVLDNLITMQETTSEGLTDSQHDMGTAVRTKNPAGSSAISTNSNQPGASLKAELSIVNIHGMSSEQLLMLCARAIENQQLTIAQQAVYALRNMSSIDGEPSERVTAYFLQALVRRAGIMLHPNLLFKLDHPSFHEVQWTERKLSLNEFTSFVDMTPYYRFGYIAANGAFLEAFEGKERVHILDFSTTHCMQWPTLIEALADRVDGPPHVRLTVSSAATLPTPPRLQPSYDEVGYRLTEFAWSKGVPFEFIILPQTLESLEANDIDLRDGEALGVNCAFRLHYLADETAAGPLQTEYLLSEPGASNPDQPYETAASLCPRNKFLRLIRWLNPAVVTLYEEDCNTTSTDLVSRLKESYNYEWMPFDFLATFLQNEDKNRLEYEKNVGRKIENIICCEGSHRIERLETKDQWVLRMRRLQFRTLPFRKDVAAALRDMLDDHAPGWGMKRADDTHLLLWKGHSLAFASAWVPAVQADFKIDYIN